MIAIIDYGAGNIRNVQNILEHLGEETVITSDPKILDDADKIVLPGVGAFGFIMHSLREKGLDNAIHKQIASGKPFLGVCIGLQVMFEGSEESPDAIGLGVFKGKVIKFRHGKVPHVGWNNVHQHGKNNDSDGFDNGYAYFVHSYYPSPVDKDIILFESEYGEKFCTGVMKDNVIAVQFHPERSGKWGIEFYRRWLNGEIKR